MSAIKKAITKEELSCHCRRRTRDTELTLQLIEGLLLKLSTATDSLGYSSICKLFNFNQIIERH